MQRYVIICTVKIIIAKKTVIAFRSEIMFIACTVLLADRTPIPVWLLIVINIGYKWLLKYLCLILLDKLVGWVTVFQLRQVSIGYLEWAWQWVWLIIRCKGLPLLVCLNVDKLRLDLAASLDYYCPVEWAWQWVWSVTRPQWTNPR